MLEYLRNASEKPVAKILIGILSFSFVGWGVAEWIFGGAAGDNTLMNVGDAEISVQQFNSVKSGELSQMTREQQRDIYTDANAQRAFNERVLSDMVGQRMTQNRADDLGYVVSDKRIASEVRSYPEFQVNGEFSTLAFDRTLSNSGYSEDMFANVLRAQILRSMVLGPVSAPLFVPDFAVKAAYDARYSERDIEYAIVKYSEFDAEKPTDEQLAEYYKQHPQIVPETRTVSYVFVPAEMAQPDKYDAGYAIAVKVEDDIIAGETMADAAKKHGAKYVDLGTFGRDNRPVDKLMTDSMVAKIFDMDEGLESEMIETKDGFVFVRVDKVNPEHNADFETVKKTVTADWAKSQQEKQAYMRANELLVDLNQGGKLAGATSTTVSRASGAPLEVLTAAFHNDSGTKLIVPGIDVFYVLNVKQVLTPKVDNKKMESITTELQNMSATGLQQDYNSFLKREYPVQINDRLYNRVFGH